MVKNLKEIKLNTVRIIVSPENEIVAIYIRRYLKNLKILTKQFKDKFQ